MADEVSKSVGFRPPPPVTAPATPVKPRTTINDIGGTAGATDPLAASNAALPLGKTRADFLPAEFQRALLQHGKRVIWRKAMLCPCINPTSDQARLDCTQCDGSGYFYVDPLPIQAHMASFDNKTRMYEKFGLWVTGSVSVTTQNQHRLAWRDSLEAVDEIMNFNELVKKNNRRGKRANLPAGTDAARYRIAQLTKVLVNLNGVNSALEIGYHVTLNPQGHIVWTHQGNELVPNDTTVSIHYDFHPVWIVTSHPHAARSDINGFKKNPDHAIGLPLQAGAQLDYLAETERILPVTGEC